MAKMRRKGDLPTKICASCGKPFAWRKKWAKVWHEVRYCSDRCRGTKSRGPTPPESPPGDVARGKSAR